MKKVTPGTKTFKVLKYLETGHSLDIPKAIALWGHVRLSDIIFRLRNKGYPITTEVIENGPVKFAIYRLPKVPNKDTKEGTLVRINTTAPDRYHGMKGRIEKNFGDSHIYNVKVAIKGFSIVGFKYSELEIID